MRHEIVLKFDLLSGRKLLRAGTRLRVIASNSYGARAADAEREIHVVRASDFDWA
jgi:hypothetical protein